MKIVDGVKTIEWYTPDNSTVAGLQQTVGQHTTEIDGLKTRMDTAEGDIDTNTTNIETNTSNITKITDGTTVVGKASKDAKGNVIDTTYATKTELTDDLATKANSADVYKKTETYSQTEVDDKVAAAISSVYKPAGSSDFADLPTPAVGILGNVYNVNNAFETDEKFVEGTGKKYPAGTNVVVVKVDTDYKYDVLAGMTDLTNYYTKKQVDDAIDADVKVVTDGLADGTVVPKKATSAVTDDADHVIKEWYAPLTSVQNIGTNVDNIVNGTTIVGKASKDAKGNVIDTTYVTKTELDEKLTLITLAPPSSIATEEGTIELTPTEKSTFDEADKNRLIIAVGPLDSDFSYFYVSKVHPSTSVTTYYFNSPNGYTGYINDLGSQSGTISFYYTKTPESATKSSVDSLTTLVSQLGNGLDQKVDKVTGKGLSTNDYTTEEKTKLAGITTGAQVNAIDSVDTDEFLIDESKKLSINKIASTKIDGLATVLDTKLENVKLAGATDNLPISDKTVTLPGATAATLGLVKGSAANNGVTINADFTMTVNNITTDKLVQGTDTLIWNGGSAASAG